jgi:hypothetical protein
LLFTPAGFLLTPFCVILAAVYLLLFSPPFFILNFSLSFADKNEDSCLSVNIYIYWIG